MKHLVLALSFAASVALAGSVQALENQLTICTSGDQERKIEVVYEGDMAAPCEVQYTKASGMQVLWQATLEEGFCEEKASGLVEKHVGWGWSCELASAAGTSGTVTEPAAEVQ